MVVWASRCQERWSPSCDPDLRLRASVLVPEGAADRVGARRMRAARFERWWSVMLLDAIVACGLISYNL